MNAIYIGTTKLSQAMHFGMQDVIDASGYALRKTGQKHQTRIEFDKLMGFDQTQALIDSDATVDMRAKRFVVNRPFFYAGNTTRGFNYVKIVIDVTNYDIVGAPTQSEVFYAFITNVTPNNSQSITCTFEIDWWHTFVCNNEALPSIFECYVVRDNVHNIVNTGGAPILQLDVGHGAEPIRLFDLQELESAYHYVSNETISNADTGNRFYYAKIVFSENPGKIQGYDFSNLGRDVNGLITVFIPVIVYHSDNIGGVVFYSDSVSADTILAADKGITWWGDLVHISKSPYCCSIEIIWDLPIVKSDLDGTYTFAGDSTATNVINFVIYSDRIGGVIKNEDPDKGVAFQVVTNFVYPNQKSIAVVELTGKCVEGIAATEEGVAADLESYNAPKNTCVFSAGATAEAQQYSHNRLRTEAYVDPKIAQPQFSKIQFNDNQGGILDIDTTQSNALKLELVKVCDYNGTNSKHKFYIDGYAGDHGKRYCGVNQKVSSLPLVNDALIDYLNANKNQMVTGLALAKRSAVLGGVAGVFGGVAGAGIAAAKQSPLGIIGGIAGAITSAANTALQIDTINQQHEAQIADLEQRADTVDSVAGNNAEFDISDHNGEIMRYIWSPSKKDRARLVEYFHKNGYAVGEWRHNSADIFTPISLDNMYYFDYLQATDIDFYTSSLQPPSQNISIECEIYLRNLFARGVRIWHGRTNASGHYEFFRTTYLNTRKEY